MSAGHAIREIVRLVSQISAGLTVKSRKWWIRNEDAGSLAEDQLLY